MSTIGIGKPEFTIQVNNPRHVKANESLSRDEKRALDEKFKADNKVFVVDGRTKFKRAHATMAKAEAQLKKLQKLYPTFDLGIREITPLYF